MVKRNKFLYIILLLLLIFYYIIGTISDNIVWAITARSRETNLENLNNENYPGVKALINDLKLAHPNWSFTILYTGLDWETVIKNETTTYHGRSLVQNSTDEWICPTCGKSAYDNGTWYCASVATVKYYMDIRNWLKEEYIFAFETLSYDSSIQTVEGVKSILKGTFMDTDTITYTDTEGKKQTIQKSYAQIIMEAAKKYKVSPYHMASRLRQEQGVTGSELISGTCTYKASDGSSLVGYYNYFNVMATGSGIEKICRNGLTYAKNHGWTNPELAIHGGAEFLASGYIDNYQDSLYLEKYQVDSAGGLYSHQYMQNVSAPYTEGYSVYKAYKEIGVLDNNFNFVIPVFENMPKTISAIPTTTAKMVTENVRITTVSSNLPLRAGPTANSSCLVELPKNAIVLRIEKAIEKQNGYYWDKIIYNTGTKIYIGYANSEYLTKTADIETTNIEATTNDAVILRNGPGTVDTSIIKILSKDEKITIIDKMTYKINGYIWYRLKLQDGTQGYIASDFVELKTEKKQEESSSQTQQETENKQKEENYKIDGEYMIIAPTTLQTEIERATTESKTWGTGAKVKIGEKTYTLAMIGDVNGDGNITPADYVKIKNHIMGTSTLEDTNKLAADVNKDGNITPADYVKVKNHIMNISKISL